MGPTERGESLQFGAMPKCVSSRCWHFGARFFAERKALRQAPKFVENIISFRCKIVIMETKRMEITTATSSMTQYTKMSCLDSKVFRSLSDQWPKEWTIFFYLSDFAPSHDTDRTALALIYE